MTPAPQGAAASVVVATSCPRCGAPLELGETANATRCGHCRAHLAVTGRGQTLSYQIAPRVSPADARSLVRFAQPNNGTHHHVGDPRLFLFPYYRLTGLELRWTRAPEPERQRPRATPRFANGEAELLAIASAIAIARQPRPLHSPLFGGRWVERNVAACDTAGLASYSLGIRPSVLRLELFRPDPAATAVAPTYAAEQALDLAKAAGPDGPAPLHTTMLARHLSVVYFPYWVIDVRATDRHRCVIVDGTSSSIVASDIDPDVLMRLAAPRMPAVRTLGFRPLVCPNCGWDLPEDPDQVVFHCQSCMRAWELSCDGLASIPYAVAPIPKGTDSEYEMLPVWILDRPGAESHDRVFAPAFHFRNVRRAVDLGRSLTRIAAEPPEHADCDRPLGRCHLDRADGAAFGRFVLAGLQPDGLPPTDGSSAHAPTLAWLPFRVGPYALHEPRTGTALPKRLLP